LLLNSICLYNTLFSGSDSATWRTTKVNQFTTTIAIYHPSLWVCYRNWW